MRITKTCKRMGTALISAMAAFPLSTQAVDFSANIGFTNKYIFRGVPQSDNSLQGGLDLQAGGFYLGTWAADVDDGAEIDFYAGYGWDIGEDAFCLLYTSPSPRDQRGSRMPSSA